MTSDFVLKNETYPEDTSFNKIQIRPAPTSLQRKESATDLSTPGAASPPAAGPSPSLPGTETIAELLSYMITDSQKKA